MEITLLAGLGLGSVALWTGWKMQQILIANHQQNVEYVAARFPRDVQLYSEMFPFEGALQKTINDVPFPGLLIWVKNSNGRLLAQSANLAGSSKATIELMSLAEMPSKAQVHQVGEQFLVLRGSPITLPGVKAVKVYLAQDVTTDRQQLIAAIQSLTLVCLVATLTMMLAITLRIQRSLQPLQEMSQMAGAISAEDLGKAKLQLRHAPSEVKELAQMLNMMLSRLSDAWEQQRQFVSNISHELRTPLTIVLGYLQSLLRRSTNLNDYQREALETAASETDRTVRLLQDLLDLARAESGYVSFHLERLLLNDLVAEVAGMAAKFSQRTIEIVAAEFVEAIADRDRLKQVLLNLIDNAVKYSDADQPVVLKLEQVGRQAIIAVCDRGSGIPLPDQNRIFEHFYRVNENRFRAPEGHGLGLAIVKTLVEGMGGTITIRSKPGEGSTFAIALPLPSST